MVVAWLRHSPGSFSQISELADAANQPYRAGRVDTGEVFLVTQQNYTADPAGFTGYENYFRVYVMAGDEMKELAVVSASRMRDGGSTRIKTDSADFNFPIRGESTVGGHSLTTRLDFMQLSKLPRNMIPTLKAEDYILVRMVGFEPKRGDVVVVQPLSCLESAETIR